VTVGIDELSELARVGFANTPTTGDVRTLELARRPDTIAMFEQLAVHANRPTRLYAYWALRTLAPVRAARFELALRNDDTFGGCNIHPIETGKLLAEIERHPMPTP
jgi:hypothetical protein